MSLYTVLGTYPGSCKNKDNRKNIDYLTGVIASKIKDYLKSDDHLTNKYSSEFKAASKHLPILYCPDCVMIFSLYFFEVAYK